MLVTERKENEEPARANLPAHIAPTSTASGPAIEPEIVERKDSNRSEVAAPETSRAQAPSGNAGSKSASVRQALKVLIVEDDPNDIELSLHALYQGGFESDCAAVQTREEFTERVRLATYDVVLADYNLPLWNGMETVDILRQEGLDIPVIVISGYLGELRAVECIKQGAADYVLKDHLLRLPESVRLALREKKLREEHRCAQEDLARSNRDLEQFAYVASHDLQEPLRMVAIYTQLLAERYRGKLDDDADKYIHYAVDGATRMQTLVQDLLAFSRVGRQGTEFKLSDCAVVIDIALKNLHTAIQESSAHVECGFLPSVVADSSQLTQLFQNLIGNAIKFRGPSRPWFASRRKKPSRRSSFPWRITASASLRNMPIPFLSSSNAYTRAPNIRAAASAWPFARRSSNGTADGSGWNPYSVTDAPSDLPCPQRESG